jgi:bla regulator protein BlaR1
LGKQRLRRIESGANAETYAESVLKTCRFCLESSFPCVAGITGADLKKRVVRIVSQGQVKSLRLRHRILLATAAVITILTQLVAGDFRIAQIAVLANSQDAIHSAKDSSNAFEVASIRPTTFQPVGAEGGSRSEIEYTADRLTMRNIDVGEMIQWAYGLEYYRVSGEHVLQGQRYDVRARASGRVNLNTLRLMLQDLLATRFKLQIHWESRRTAVYELVADRGGARLPEDKGDMLLPSYPRESYPRVVDGSFVFTNVSLAEFADQLADLRGIGLPVIDHTGIAGIYDITLKSAAHAILESDEMIIPTLIQKQLGLKLVPAKDLVQVLVVEHVEKPSAN